MPEMASLTSAPAFLLPLNRSKNRLGDYKPRRFFHKADIPLEAMAIFRVHRVFDEYAERYDAWYDSPKGRALLGTEVACLRPLLSQFPQPYLEVGVGTGRFA